MKVDPKTPGSARFKRNNSLILHLTSDRGGSSPVPSRTHGINRNPSIMKTILRSAICSILLLPLSTPAGAQNAPVIDMEARKASQETLRRHIEMRERRLAELTEEISTLANRTDTRIEELVTLLSGIRDSQQSRHNVSQIKAQAVQGLRRMIETYRRERREVAERLRTDRSRPMEALNRDIDLIDARIEKRVADIIQLTRSIPTRENIDRIETTGYGSSTFWGGWYENTRVSEDWRQNRRDGVQATRQRRELTQALEQSVQDLERRRRTLVANLRGRALTPPAREIQTQELNRVDAILDQRRSQLMELATPIAPPSQTVSRNEARDLSNLLDSARRDIASDFAKTLRLFNDAAQERDRLHALRENFEARERWLVENNASELPEEPEQSIDTEAGDDGAEEQKPE
jgi:hypothetical protein